jgi:hypothetical protein
MILSEPFQAEGMMMRRMNPKASLTGVIILGALSLAGGSAMAQRSPNPAAFRTTEVTSQPGAAWDEINRRTLGKPRVSISHKQYDRANRVAGLLNKGQCMEAYQLAVDERDNKLAARVTEICTPKS